MAEGPSGRTIYKGELISGREKRGGHGAVISPERRLDFRDGSKDKIRCGYGGVKNGLMEDDVTADYPDSRG